MNKFRQDQSNILSNLHNLISKNIFKIFEKIYKMKYSERTKGISLLAFIFLQFIKLTEAQIQVNVNQTGTIYFGYNQLAFVQVNSVQNETFLEFIINISNNQDPNFNNYCFLLLMSSKQIKQQNFQTDVIYTQNNYSPFMRFIQTQQVLNVDFEGLASANKVLFLDYQQDSYNPFSTLYYYIIGPYLFAGASPISSPQGNNQLKNFTGTFSIKDQMSCLNNCNSQNGQGQCNNSDPFNTYCVCQVGYIARDCSTPAQQIVINNPAYIIQIPSQTKVYAYFDIDQSTYSVGQVLIIEASFTSDADGFLISIQQDIQNQSYLPDYFLWLASRLNTQVGKVISNKSQQFNLLITPSTQGARIIVLFVANENTQIKFQVYPLSSGSGGSNLIILYIILGALGFIVLVYIIYIVRRSKMIRRSNQQFAQNVANQQANLQGQQQGRVRQQQQLQKLTIEQLNEYMPIQSFDKNMMKAPSSELCSVCLEEFVFNKDLVRVTICQHVFHNECLEEWLKKQQNCPSCRQELTLQRLKEFKQNPILYQNVQNLAVKPISIHPINIEQPVAQNRNNEQVEPNQILIHQQQQDREIHEAPPRL
ncbi:hypothetical protein ABPG72_016935 [Tetrahymena utriculariae]